MITLHIERLFKSQRSFRLFSAGDAKGMLFAKQHRGGCELIKWINNIRKIKRYVSGLCNEWNISVLSIVAVNAVYWESSIRTQVRLIRLNPSEMPSGRIFTLYTVKKRKLRQPKISRQHTALDSWVLRTQTTNCCTN